MKLSDLPDHTLAELITESRERLASVVTPGECIGRRVARQNFRLLEAEMVARYETEVWGQA